MTGLNYFTNNLKEFSINISEKERNCFDVGFYTRDALFTLLFVFYYFVPYFTFYS